MLMLVPGVFGLSIAEPYPVPYPTGTNHYYTVTFDGEGEALVSAKITIVNTGDDNLTTIEIEIPGEAVRIINIVQEAQTVQKRCIKYDNICVIREEQVCIEYSSDGSCTDYRTVRHHCKYRQQQCVAWEEFYGYPLQYFKLAADQQRLSHSSLLKIPLEQAAPPGESATILLTYKATGYAQKSLGVWSFKFQTPKRAVDTEHVRVSISTTPEFTLAGGEAEVDYLPEVAFAAASPDGVASQEMTDYSRRIEYHSGFVKESYGLDPWESLHVDGAYAKSKALLHKGRIVFGFAGVATLLGLCYLGITRIRFKKMKGNIPVLIGLVSFSSAVSLMTLFVMGGWILGNLYYWMDSIGLLLAFALVVMGLALLFGPPVLLGLKKGFLPGLITFVATVVWVIMLSVLAIIVFAVLGGGIFY